MNRTLIGVLSTMVLIFAGTSFATANPQRLQPDVVSKVSTAPTHVPAVVPMSGRPAPRPRLRVVTGEVLMTTPLELVLRTRSGVQSFEITPQSRIRGGTGEGDIITVHYRPAHGSARASVARSTAPSTDNHSKVASPAAVTPRAAAVSGG